ncbi:hypothetical protein [Neisseria cinerea]|uniref:hypothetical protein n=1 Tax=Neisseria cinerea TaxID=483 RepID=UPI000D386595|nr:hypothetical protein [Neisseria cinerea]
MKTTVLFLALGFAAAAAQAKTPQQIVQESYPKYSQKYQCYRVNIKDSGEYCVRQIKSETRQTAQGRLMYLLFAGNVFDFKNGNESGAHVQNGMAGIFVLKQADGGWKLLASQPHSWAGSFGIAPEAKDWSFHEFGKDRWGFMTKYSDVHHGYSGAAYRLFVHNGAGKITDSTLFAEADNEGALGDCSENRYEDRENTAEERRECQKARYSLSSTIKVLEIGKPNAGFYPIRLTVSGFDGFKTYNGDAFVSSYNAASGRYSMPKGYPLKDKEF